MDNEQKIKQAAFRVAFLMQHQHIAPELELEAQRLFAVVDTHHVVNKASADYVAGAADALAYLLKFLRQKGPQI